MHSQPDGPALLDRSDVGRRALVSTDIIFDGAGDNEAPVILNSHSKRSIQKIATVHEVQKATKRHLYLLEDERSRYWPSFFQRTIGTGCPRGGTHLKTALFPKRTWVSLGESRNSSLRTESKRNIMVSWSRVEKEMMIIIHVEY